jgi:formyltetrahydrofolate synthetase
VVAINRFSSDTQQELEVIKDKALKAGAFGIFFFFFFVL